MDSCIPIAEMESYAANPEGDRRFRHVASCPRCRALLASYHAFLKPEGLPAGADPGDAEANLTAFLDREVRGRGRPVASSDAPAKGVLSAWIRRVFAGGRLRPALLAVCAVLVFFGIRQAVTTDFWREAPTVYRGPETNPVSGLAVRSQLLSDRSVILSWDAFPGADAYQVILYGDDLRERFRLDPAPALDLRLDSKNPETWRGTGYWRVEALGERAVIGRSPLRALPRSDAGG